MREPGASGSGLPGRAVLGDRRMRQDPYPAYCFACLATISILCALEPRLLHWFLIPVLACGLLIGRDATRWVSGRLDPFDPKGIIGVIGVHLFFVAPLLIVFWDFPYDVAASPEDWRPWLGIMAAVNAAGLILYFVLSNVFHHRRPARRARRWRIDDKRALNILIPALVISGAAQLYLWIRYGGISGQIEGFKSGELGDVVGRFKYQLLAGAFPILLLILLSVLRARRDRQRGNYTVAFSLILLTGAIYFITDGLRGSRSTTVWTLFWATGIVHYFWRRLSARMLLMGLVPILLFMYLYGFYKAYGNKLWETYAETESITALSQRSGRTVRRMLISDLSRSDIQAFMVYRLYAGTASYQLQWGMTYVETVPRVLIPATLWAGRPTVPRKAVAGARLHFGGAAPYSERLSKVYGLAGEGLLNFHIPGALVAFALFGVAMGAYRRHLVRWPEYDARLFIAPLMANGFLTVLTGDFDNVITFALTKGVFPALVLLLICRREIMETPRNSSS